MINSIPDNKIKKAIRKILPSLVFVLIWHLIAMKIAKPYIMPSPYETLQALLNILSSSKYLTDILYTLGRMLLSFSISFLIGTLFAAGSSRFEIFEEFLSPLMTVIKSVPTMGIILLSLIWFRAEGTVLFVCSLIIMPIIYSNMLYGLKSFDKKLLEMGKQFCFGFKKSVRYIYWPSLKPFINSAIAAGISLNMKVLVAAEVFGQPKRAIGTNLFNSKAIIDTPGIFAWSLVVIILSYTIERNIMSLRSKKR